MRTNSKRPIWVAVCFGIVTVGFGLATPAAHAATSAPTPAASSAEPAALAWTTGSASCAGASGETLQVAGSLVGAITGHEYALFNDYAGGSGAASDQASDNTLTASSSTLAGTFEVSGLRGPFTGWVRDLDDEAIMSNHLTIGTVCPPPVVDVGDPPGAVLTAQWSIRATGCSHARVTALVQISHAIKGVGYGLFGTSGYQASTTMAKAPAATFTHTFTLGSSWKSFKGDVEAPSIRQSSAVRSIGPACDRQPIQRHTPAPVAPSTHQRSAASSAVAVTHTQAVTTSSASAEPIVQPLPSEAASARRTSSKAREIVGALLIAIALLLGGGGVAYRFRTRK